MFPDVIVGKQMRSYSSKESILSSPDELRMRGISSPVPNKQGPGPESLLVPHLLGNERKRSGSLPISIDIQTTTELVRTSTIGAKPGEEVKKTKDVETSLPPISSKLSLTASPKFGRSPSTSPNQEKSPNQDKVKFSFGEDSGSMNSPKSSPSHKIFSPPNPSPQPSPPMSPRSLRSVRCSSPVLSSHKLKSFPKKLSVDSIKAGERPMFYSPQLARSKKPDTSPSHRHSSNNLKGYYSPTASTEESLAQSSTLWTGYSQGSLKPLEGRESSQESLECQENRKKLLASAADIVNGVVVQRHQPLPKIRASSLSSPSLSRSVQQGEGLTLPTTEEETEEGCAATLSLQHSNSGLEQKDLSLPSFQPPYLNVDVKKV